MNGRYLLDTHVFLWWFGRRSHLKAAAHVVLADLRSRPHLSVASIWEMKIKQAAGRLDVPDDMLTLLRRDGIETLDIRTEHAFAVADLPPHHRDPFDRMLVAQARIERLTLISRDAWIRAYDVEHLPA